jgi:hypothetical protein
MDNNSNTPSNDSLKSSLEVIGLVVLCKLSDGSIRSANTDRNIERSILSKIVSDSNGELNLSKYALKGIDIVMPT